jgi:hypothetical protein
MYDTIKDKQTGKFFMCYDGKTKFQLSKELRADIYNWKTNYILLSRTETPDKKLSLEESYSEFIKMANTLKEKTDGKINLYRTGNFKTTALNLFNDFTKHLINPDNIKQREAKLINEYRFTPLQVSSLVKLINEPILNLILCVHITTIIRKIE